MNNNRIASIFPQSIGVMTALESLYINPFSHSNAENNLLTGPLPANIFNLPNLRTVKVGNNSISGPLPSYEGPTTSLESFMAPSNFISGVLPALSKLKTLRLENNRVNGFGSLQSIASLDEL